LSHASARANDGIGPSIGNFADTAAGVVIKVMTIANSPR
jgi:hypothetical protein